MTRPTLPSGTVTFLFSDMERSTERAVLLGDRRYAELLETHRTLLREAFAAHEGYEVGTEGDACFVAFARAVEAASAAIDGQRAVEGYPWPGEHRIRVRMGLHTGEALVRDGDYVGHDVHRAKRVCDAGHGGQILLSEATAALVGAHLPEGASLSNLGPHRLKDLGEPQPLFQLMGDGLQHEFSPLRTLEAVRHNLPVELTAFVGRERELGEVAGLLTGSRLLTLTGAGGVGKTRLALQVAADVVDDFRDGVWLVDLATTTDAELVFSAAAAAVGLHEDTGGAGALAGAVAPTSPEDRLVDWLRPKAALVVLDNCEHLVAAVCRLAESVLRECPGARILVTSREALGVGAETAWRVPSLDVPEEMCSDTDALARFEAVRLFVERAQHQQPGFALDDRNCAAIGQICRRLDGIPLAIELAAARVAMLSADQIAERLDDRFRLLVGGSRTALERQQTLRATVDWSYDMLSEPERALLDRLSVFAGGFTLDAAEAVGAAGGTEVAEILDLLTSLVRRSLVVVDGLRGAARYRLLETIRQYAREKLLARGEGSSMRDRHARYFADLASGLDGELVFHVEPETAALLDDLEDEIDNLRAAMEWAAGTEAGLRLAAWLVPLWLSRGYVTEGVRVLERALEGAADAPTLFRARAIGGGLAVLHYFRGDYDHSAAAAAEGLTLARRVGDARATVEGLGWLGWCRWTRGDTAGARRFAQEALAVAREAGDDDLTRWVQYGLGHIAEQEGDWPAARAAFEDAIALARRCGATSIYSSLHGLGRVALGMGRLDEATRFFDEGLQLSLAVRDTNWIYGNGGEGLAWVAYARGDLRAAIERIEFGIDDARDSPRIVAQGLSWLAQYRIEAARDAAGLDALESRLAEPGGDPTFAWALAVVRATRALIEGRFAEGEQLALHAAGLRPDQNQELANVWLSAQVVVSSLLRGTVADLVGDLVASAEENPNEPAYRSALALAYAELGRDHDARAELERLARHDLEHVAFPSDFMTLANLSEVCAGLGDAERAAALHALLLPFEGRNVALGPAVCFGSVSRNLGLLAGVMRRWEDAQRHFSEALERNRALRARPFVALTQHGYAQMLLARSERGDRERAAELLEEALATGRELGMAGLVRRTEPLLEQSVRRRR